MSQSNITYQPTNINLLNQIASPDDLRKLNPEDLPTVCSEIREFLIEHLSQNPGHFGSSMGAVDIIVALHYVFNTPKDRIVWDVGHQAYAHKILTGRRDAFKSQRTEGGISGFPIPSESNYDTFVCGHAGNSISAALGMAIADQNTPGEENRHTIAVIGDASISSGLALEGLNNASNNPNNLIIILNDNDMAIDDNVGALHHYLSNLTTSARYNRVRYWFYRVFRKFGLINDQRKGILLRFSNALKSLISAQQNIFDGLNIRYFGPFNGNDVSKVVQVLNDIKDMKGPRIIHLQTVKGKGYKAAEENPGAWHAPGNFDPETGEKIVGATKIPLWQEVFGNSLVEMANQNEKIVGITAAMLSGTSMSKMMNAFPKRTFDVGISEGHAVTFAGGLAAAGKKPFVAIYSSFLQRAYDNIIHDVAIQGLPVTFCIDRAGVVGEDGVTHHGLFDMAYLRPIPQLSIASPLNAAQFRNLLKTAEQFDGPLAIRYPRGKTIGNFDTPMSTLQIGKGENIFTAPNARIAILTIGPIGNDAVNAATSLAEQGINADVYNMIWLKPIDEEILNTVAKKYDAIVTVEDGTIEGGFGSAVIEWLKDNGFQTPVTRLGVPGTWVTHAPVDRLHHIYGYDSKGIANTVSNLALNLNNFNKH